MIFEPRPYLPQVGYSMKQRINNLTNQILSDSSTADLGADGTKNTAVTNKKITLNRRKYSLLLLLLLLLFLFLLFQY